MKMPLPIMILLFTFLSFLNACKKTGTVNIVVAPASAYTSETALKWMDMQLRLIRMSAPFVGALPPQRFYAYSAIALYETVVNGMPGYQSLASQLTSMPPMPQIVANTNYHWAAAGNAALASMTRFYYPGASAENLTAIDSLENALNNSFRSNADTATLNRSAVFGKDLARLVFDWSKTDGAANANAPYSLPTGPGLWVPTPPANAAAFGPYWGNNRTLFSGSLANTAPAAPPPYSTDPSSDYYKMWKEVYDISQTLTPAQVANAVYYRDNPGFGGAHYLSILKQVLEQENRPLDFTAYAFAKTSIATVDAAIGCYKIKYQYNQERPITYIRNVMGYANWTPTLVTPNFPDFPSAHSSIGGAFTEVMKSLFGNAYSFTDHSYDYLGMPSRSFISFDELINDISMSRVYGGIHNRMSCDRGQQMGKAIGGNINNSLKFLK